MYAIFECRSPIGKINLDMPLIRELVKTPKDLRMDLSGYNGAYRLDSNNPIELGAVLNQLYNTDHYKEKESFFGKLYN